MAAQVIQKKIDNFVGFLFYNFIGLHVGLPVQFPLALLVRAVKRTTRFGSSFQATGRGGFALQNSVSNTHFHTTSIGLELWQSTVQCSA